MKLGKRLKQIESMVGTSYDHIWDCCCDHGLLGAALLSRHAAAHIHFVDIVPALMQQLEQKLHRFFPHSPQPNTNTQWQVHCMDTGALPLQQFPGKQLVIIAGVGGDLMVNFIQMIYQRHPNREIDFLLCPVHHQFALRQQLIDYQFGLQAEVLVAENQRFYEILLVSSNRHSNPVTSTISAVGSLLWQSSSTEQKAIASAYLQKTLTHYKRMQLNPNTNVQHIIDAYSAIII